MLGTIILSFKTKLRQKKQKKTFLNNFKMAGHPNVLSLNYLFLGLDIRKLSGFFFRNTSNRKLFLSIKILTNQCLLVQDVCSNLEIILTINARPIYKVRDISFYRIFHFRGKFRPGRDIFYLQIVPSAAKDNLEVKKF